MPPRRVGCGGAAGRCHSSREYKRCGCRRRDHPTRRQAGAGCRARRAAFAVPSSVAVIKTIDMDASLGDRELEVEVVLEADRHLPFGDDEIALDFEQLHLSATDPSQAEVLLAGCRAEHVERRRAALESAGLKAVAADIETFCQQRAVRTCEPADWAVLAVAEVGATATSLCVADRDAVVFTRAATV